MTAEELQQRWTSENLTNLHYSFYLLIVSIIFFAASIATVALSSVEFRPVRYATNMNGKSMDGLMMY